MAHPAVGGKDRDGAVIGQRDGVLHVGGASDGAGRQHSRSAPPACVADNHRRSWDQQPVAAFASGPDGREFALVVQRQLIRFTLHGPDCDRTAKAPVGPEQGVFEHHGRRRWAVVSPDRCGPNRRNGPVGALHQRDQVLVRRKELMER